MIKGKHTVGELVNGAPDDVDYVIDNKKGLAFIINHTLKKMWYIRLNELEYDDDTYESLVKK